MKRKLILAVALVTVTGLTAGAVFTRRGVAAPEVLTGVVSRGEIVSAISASGTLEAVTTVQVGTQVSGQVAEIHVDFNDRVRKGQLIARIDPTLARQNVRDAEATVGRSRAEAEQARREFDRSKQLFDNEALSVSEYETAQYQLDVARANLASAELNLERARQNLSYTQIYAPIDGIVVERNVDVGQTVAASLSAPQLFLIANDLSEMQILASVDESDIGQIRQGQPVQFTVQAFPNEFFAGMVEQVRLQSTVQENVVNYTVVVGVDNRAGKLLPGMTATVDFEVQTAQNVLMVPNAALRFRPTPEMLAAAGASPGTTAAATRESATARRPNGTSNGADSAAVRGRSNAATIWYVDAAGQLVTARVTTGISDGIMTEIDGPALREGMQVIAGVLQAGENGSNNPFNQEQPDRRARGGF
jgi:HlyD family secretion protein